MVYPFAIKGNYPYYKVTSIAWPSGVFSQEVVKDVKLWLDSGAMDTVVHSHVNF